MGVQANLLLGDFDPDSGVADKFRKILESWSDLALRIRCFESRQASGANGRGWPELVDDHQPDSIILVLGQPVLSQEHSLLRWLQERAIQVPILVVAKAAFPEQLLELLGRGVTDFLTPPFDPIEVRARIQRYLHGSRREDELVEGLKVKLGLKKLVGQSPKFVNEIRKIPAFAETGVNVLISGETGTGKELCARAIHYLSPRSSGPFVPVNCGAIPAELVENELFGHERSAYTGATSASEGLVNEAEGGTLFLDEIDSLPMMAQVKLLRFLQEKEYRRLGSSRIRKSNVRIVAATGLTPEEAVQHQRIRRDLYYRLNILTLHLPPLRERSEDISLLARHFLTKYAWEFGKPNATLSMDAMQVLNLSDWPGNVRELEHVIERSVVIAADGVIRASDLQFPGRFEAPRIESFQEAKARVVTCFERKYIQNLLVASKGNISQAARAAGKNRRAFWELIRKHRIDVDRFRTESLS